MKCPYCCQEHPDNAKFCMETGQKLEPQKRACQNRDCPDFGAAILPLEAKFCPRCGGEIHSRVESGNGPDLDLVHILRKKLQKRIPEILK